VYALAAVVFVALGAWTPKLMLSWPEGLLVLLVVVWLVPAAIRRRAR
jgi:hypothetical protein